MILQRIIIILQINKDGFRYETHRFHPDNRDDKNSFGQPIFIIYNNVSREYGQNPNHFEPLFVLNTDWGNLISYMDILEARGSARPLAETGISISSAMIDEDSIMTESSSIIADEILMPASIIEASLIEELKSFIQDLPDTERSLQCNQKLQTGDFINAVEVVFSKDTSTIKYKMDYERGEPFLVR